MKRVLLVVIDALASRVVRPAMESGELPHLQALVNAGWVDWCSTSIFPSITPAATAALITGGYPAETAITGAYFYDRDDDRVHYYGDDVWPILKRGFSNYFQDFLVQLNGAQLRAETLYETVERAGGKAACLNYLWFRGDVTHTVKVPWLLRLWPTVPWSKTIQGPTLLSLGDFVSSRVDRGRTKLKGRGGLFRRYGFTDETTAEQLIQMARLDAFPAFTVAYFPDNDFVSHEQGPLEALETVRRVDRAIGELITIYGGIERVLESLAIVITGDHAQSDLPLEESDTGIELHELLDDFKIVPAGEKWGEDDELMICPNMRAAQIYFRPSAWARREKLVDALVADPRVDQVIWREDDSQAKSYYCVTTHDRGRLRFAPGSLFGERARDHYGASWSWSGDLETVDARIGTGQQLEYHDYPNAFERIAMAFDDEASGDLWVTSRLKYEFRLPGISIHRRGSHASLHADDSLSPLILAGFPDEDLPRVSARSVDVAPLCLNLLGIPSKRAVGQSHVRVPTSSAPSMSHL